VVARRVADLLRVDQDLEGVVVGALDRGVRQVVVGAAGYDGRATCRR